MKLISHLLYNYDNKLTVASFATRVIVSDTGKVNTPPTHTHARLTALFSGTTRVSRYQEGKTNLDFTEAKRQWVTVVSAGPYASLHLAPVR